MSGFKPYPEYKDSGVEWLGEVPAHWATHAFCHLFAERSDSNVGLKCTNLLSLSFGRIVRKDIDSLDGLLPASFETYQIVQPGDIIFRLTDLQNDKRSLRTAIVSEWGIITSAYLSAYSSRVNAAYSSYLFRSYDLRKVFYSMGGGLRQSMKFEDLRRLSILSPPAEEQAQIARFLDHETAKIDALIAEQLRLIELLQEKRQAVISHAVTKGLNPDAPMKDSGVEWLGEVPAHWQIKALRFLGTCQNGINIGGEAFGTGYPFVSYGNVYKNNLLPEAITGLVQSTFLDRERYSVKTGDVFFTRTSETVDEIGFSSTCIQDVPNAVFAGFLIRFRPSRGWIEPTFSKYYFRNQHLRIFFNKEMNLVTRASLSQDLLKQLPVPLPPLPEQLEISEYLDDVSKQISSLLDLAQETISLLTERRSALISAAVTGKIDVRDWQPPEGDSVELNVDTEAA
ncbi:restriction endonuclease subunit S [Neopusillimonas maritima]|uniref:Type I restriction modification DNA specificity domain-containing protein n=1 Tax=Neopusillimonas maritima TaxID=2026239 RepID=A0ABX9MWB4_9BURK|nr:restriction endonuclease subunit S [Neopusillimonas maritima]RII83260.1 hypothetical protein CJO09_06560 [Neopusillimonas maritima]